MQHKCVCPEEEDKKKNMIDKKIKIETKLAGNALPVVAVRLLSNTRL